MLFLANFLKGALQDELDQLFKALFRWDVPRRFVTRGALSKARRKISHRVFIDLLDVVCAFVHRHAPLTTFHGMRVFAIDGSTFRLPDTPVFQDTFGVAKSQHGGRAMGRVSILHDILNRLTCDAILAPYQTAENALAYEHLDHADIPTGSLIVADRNYADFALLRSIYDQGLHFCVRLKSNLGIVKAFNRLGVNDAVMSYKPPKTVKAKAAGKDSPYATSFPVRLVRFTIDGTTYTLMTSLLDAAHSVSDLADLYHQRWQVEESYKVKKCRMRIKDVSGLSQEIVLQDCHAKVFSECLTAALMLEAQNDVAEYSRTTVNDYKISFTQVVAKMKDTLVLPFTRPNPLHLLRDLAALIRECLVDIKPGRKFKRKSSGKSGPKMQTQSTAYKYNR